MAYRPSLEDTPEPQMQSQAAVKYQPSLEDTPDEDISKNLYSQYQDFMQPNRLDSSGNPMVETFLGRMPQHVNKKDMPSLTQADMNKAAGAMTMLLAPEVSWVPKAIRGAMPFAERIPKLAKDYLSSVAKVGASSAAGTKMMGGDVNDSLTAGLIGSGLTAVTNPIGMMISSLNPYYRIAAGALTGAGIGQLVNPNHPYFNAALGGFGGLRGGSAQHAAVEDTAQALRPEEKILARERMAAGKEVGVPLTLPEASGNEILEAMQHQASLNPEAAKVLYPFGKARQADERIAYKNLLDQISPRGARDTIERAAYKQAWEQSEQQRLRPNVAPIIAKIEEKLPEHASGSEVYKALSNAKRRLAATDKTIRENEMQLQPFNNVEREIQSNRAAIQSKMNMLQENPPNVYLSGGSTYEQQMNAFKNAMAQQDSALDALNKQKQIFMQENKIMPQENRLEQLHNAKMGISGLISKTKDTTAVGELKLINKELIDTLKQESGQYKEAAKIAERRMARSEIVKKMRSSELTGSNLYDRVLKNDDQYNDLYKKLGNPDAPKVETQAQRTLRLLKVALPDLLNNEVKRSARTMARDSSGHLLTTHHGLIKQTLNNVYMNRYQKAIAELFTNPRWEKELDEIEKLKNKEDRGIRLGRLISQVSIAGGEGMQFNTQGSTQNGAEQ